MDAAEVRRLKQPEDESAELKRQASISRALDWIPFVRYTRPRIRSAFTRSARNFAARTRAASSGHETT
jgi:hypothetical protein